MAVLGTLAAQNLYGSLVPGKGVPRGARPERSGPQQGEVPPADKIHGVAGKMVVAVPEYTDQTAPKSSPV